MEIIDELEPVRRGPEERGHALVGRMDVTVEVNDQHALPESREDLRCEGTRREQRVAEAVRSPRHRRHEQGDRRRSEPRQLQAYLRACNCRGNHLGANG